VLKSFLRVPLENVKERICDLGVLGNKVSVVSFASNLLAYVSLDLNLSLASRGELIYTSKPLPGRTALKDFVGTEPVNFNDRTDKPDKLM